MLPVMMPILLNKGAKYYTNGTENVFWVQGYHAGNTHTWTKESVNLLLSGERTFAATHETLVTNTLVNLTKIKTLYVEWENTGSASANQHSHLIASTVKDGNVSTFDAVLELKNAFSRKISTLDVSALSGLFYIRVGFAIWSNGLTSNLLVYRVWGK